MPGNDGEVGDVGFIVDGAGSSQAKKGPLEARSGFSIEPTISVCILGKGICDFQVNSFKLADMATKIEQARLLLYRATWLRDQNRPFGKEAAMAKLVCSEVFHDCANEAVQLHGGYGLMKEFPVERFYRDQKLLEIGEGTSEIQRLVIARHVIGKRI